MVKKKQPPADPRHARWARRPDERPREILEAALRVFSARSFATTRLEDVAAAAGVTKGTIYYYFKNKEDLLVRLVASRDRELFADLEAQLNGLAGPVSAKLRMLMRKGFCDPADESQRLLHLVIHELHADSPKVFVRAIQNSLVEGWTLLAKLIEVGKQSGEFRQDADAEVAARVFTSGLVLQQLWRGGMELDTLDPFDKDRMVDSTIELFLHSLRPTVSVLPSTRPAGKRRARHS
ncbi:MAG: TetR/AcrR family transcriptional regulator [Gemmatimonadetes bacterium]|nr:TetR/AcrR family transcriptional regulator [Gemmatimonadota bacterium]